jgi:hypothetical protein
MSGSQSNFGQWEQPVSEIVSQIDKLWNTEKTGLGSVQNKDVGDLAADAERMISETKKALGDLPVKVEDVYGVSLLKVLEGNMSNATVPWYSQEKICEAYDRARTLIPKIRNHVEGEIRVLADVVIQRAKSGEAEAEEIRRQLTELGSLAKAIYPARVSQLPPQLTLETRKKIHEANRVARQFSASRPEPTRLLNRSMLLALNLLRRVTGNVNKRKHSEKIAPTPQGRAPRHDATPIRKLGSQEETRSPESTRVRRFGRNH